MQQRGYARGGRHYRRDEQQQQQAQQQHGGYWRGRDWGHANNYERRSEYDDRRSGGDADRRSDYAGERGEYSGSYAHARQAGGGGYSAPVARVPHLDEFGRVVRHGAKAAKPVAAVPGDDLEERTCVFAIETSEVRTSLGFDCEHADLQNVPCDSEERMLEAEVFSGRETDRKSVV